MWKRISLIILAFSLAAALAGCGAGGDEQTLKVGATQVPHAEILEQVKPDLEKKGIHLEVKVFQDYVTPNKAVEEGQLDANFFQHVPWMKTTNKERGWHLKKVTGVHIEPMGAYSEKIDKVSELKKGATVALPNATSEMTRVLLLLDKEGLIKLNNRNGEKTLKDIEKNPKNLKFKPLEAAALPRFLDQVDLAVINTNYALQAKLNPKKDALFLEGKDSPYVNVLAVKEGNENKKAVKELAKALHSPKVKKFIEKKYKGAVVPAF
ncbi:D-methionine transport system substrate-binding protein [Melghirimyces profundicolus]|uniref:D-methionine transport system substrate-binding protein n=1 Tax=Melghirimyces profundicolus TaxID=1242148 RepID=A0A2T6C2L5_9BACL|nr:MetQ/NlpA family ABC transporter substrate-binding protein [Melghirimyces profundicolus]PTX62559.1 D-methionine transport system substrate-binding protein [Melghirimyces profundicolus]